MLSEDTLKALAEPMAYRLEKFNESILEDIGNKIKEIGEVSRGDIEKIYKLKQYGTDVNKIKTELARITNLNKKDIEKMFVSVALESDEIYKTLSKIRGESHIPFKQNKELQEFVAAMAKQTIDTYINLSQTTGFMVYKGEVKGFTTMSETYSEVIDRAVIAVSTGVEDYYSAMRKSMRDLADSGLRTKYTPLMGRAGQVVEYATGYSRRLDTAVRQNILWGAKQCAQGIMEQVGKEFGADGYEIDYHPNPRPSHAEMGGRMYDAGSGKMVNGIYYPPIATVQHLLDDYNCLHFKTPVILGVSVPKWDTDELKRIKAKDKESVEYEGRKYTRYEATQVQRKLETSMRHAKDRQKIAAAAGDDVLRREEQAKINTIKNKYIDFSKATGLTTKAERASISNYYRVKTLDELKKRQKDSIIKLQKEADILIDKFTPCLENVKTGEIVSTTFSKVDTKTLKLLNGWKFDWNSLALTNTDVYKLTIKGDDTIQGLVALTDVPTDKAVYVDLTESAPHNMGKSRQFYGVGGHLFAIAAQKSNELGYGGFMYMDAKNLKLVKHYHEKLGAVLIGQPHKYRMYIDEQAANKLLEIYTLKGE